MIVKKYALIQGILFSFAWIISFLPHSHLSISTVVVLQAFLFFISVKGVLNLFLGLVLVFVGLLPGIVVEFGQLATLRLPEVQTPEVADLVLVATSSGFLGLSIGSSHRWFASHKMGFKFSTGRTSTILLFIIAICLLVLHSWYMGASLFSDGAWNSDGGAPIFNTILQLGGFFLLISLFSVRSINPVIVSSVFFLLGSILFLFKGARLDFISVVLCVLFYFEFRVSKVDMNFKALATLAVAFMLFTFVGVWRFVGGVGFLYEVNMVDLIFDNFGGATSIFVNGTFGDLAIDFFAIIYAIDNSLISYDYGSFLGTFFANSLPSSLAGGGPLYDYFVNDIFGYGSVAGGFTPLAQGYLAAGNFGVFTLFFVGGSLNSLAYKVSDNFGSHYKFDFTFLILLAYVSSSTRGWLYGLFGLYKGMLTAILVIPFVVFLVCFLKKRYRFE